MPLNPHLNVPGFLHGPQFRTPEQHPLQHSHPRPPGCKERVHDLCPLDIVHDDARHGPLRGGVRRRTQPTARGTALEVWGTSEGWGVGG